jgi:hypothetical protein
MAHNASFDISASLLGSPVEPTAALATVLPVAVAAIVDAVVVDKEEGTKGVVAGRLFPTSTGFGRIITSAIVGFDEKKHAHRFLCLFVKCSKTFTFAS